MDRRKSYLFEYIATKATMPRKRACCPFMQRTIYRISRNLARMDLSFTCPEVSDLETDPQQTTAEVKVTKQKRLNKRKQSNTGVLAWLARSITVNPSGHREHKGPDPGQPSSGPHSSTASVDELSTANTMHVETCTAASDVEAVELKKKRKQLRRQKMSDYGISIDENKRRNTTDFSNSHPVSDGASESTPTYNVSRHEVEVEQNLPQIIKKNKCSVAYETAELPFSKPQLNLRTVHVKRIHARRASSSSQPGGDSFDQFLTSAKPPPRSQPPFTSLANKQCTERHTRDADTPHSSGLNPPFAVCDPVEKQVQSWLESTSDEYDILLNRRMQMSRGPRKAENKSLELHPISQDSTTSPAYTSQRTRGYLEKIGNTVDGVVSTGARKKLPRLWKQTTPMSQAIIHNHLEHQEEQQQLMGSSRSPLNKVLNVPYFGFDSGEGSMLQSLEENPEENVISLLPPVSVQRRFSDNPLTTERGTSAYQIPSTMHLSSRHLDSAVKMQSAPVRSFCCILDKHLSLGNTRKSPNKTCSCEHLHNPSFVEIPQHIYKPINASPYNQNSPQNSMYSPHGGEDFTFYQGQIGIEDAALTSVSRANDEWASRMSPWILKKTSPLKKKASPSLSTEQQERLSMQICRSRLTNSCINTTLCEPIISSFESYLPTTPQEDILKQHISIPRDGFAFVVKNSLDGDESQNAQQISRLVPPDLVFSPASRRVSAVDIGDDVADSGFLKMLSVSPSRQLSRQNSIHSIEEIHIDSHSGSLKTTMSPQGSLGSERAYLTPEYIAESPSPQKQIVYKQWVSPAKSFEHFPGKNFVESARGRFVPVHRAMSHSPMHNRENYELARCNHQLASPDAPTSLPSARASASLIKNFDTEIFSRQQNHRKSDFQRNILSSSVALMRLMQSNSEENKAVHEMEYSSSSMPINQWTNKPYSRFSQIQGQMDACSSRTPEFLSLDSSNSDPMCHLEIEFMKEHRHSFNSDASVYPRPVVSCHVGNCESAGERTQRRDFNKLKSKLVTTSVDCLNSPRMDSCCGGKDLGQRATTQGSVNLSKSTYHEAVYRLARKKQQRMTGKELHPRKSLEVESAWSSPQSLSLHSSKSPSRRDSNVKLSLFKTKSSETGGSDIRPAQLPYPRHMHSSRQFRRDYTIDQKSDEIFQTFLQFDPKLETTDAAVRRAKQNEN